MKAWFFYESSGVMREAFRALGHDAWSCDLLPADDGSPFHRQGDAHEVIREVIAGGGCDLMGFHPPCTYVNGAGIHWNNRGRGWEKTEQSIEEIRWLLGLDVVSYLENPVGIISTRIRRPDQIIQPYEYGEDASKKTCLWLKGLPLLQSTQWVPPRIVNGKSRWANQTDSGQNRLGPSATRWKQRSRTYPGIAAAMAKQWSLAICKKTHQLPSLL